VPLALVLTPDNLSISRETMTSRTAENPFDIELQENLSPRSSNSSILENINEYARRHRNDSLSQECDNEDENENLNYTDNLAKFSKSGVSRKSCMLIFGICFVIWLFLFALYARDNRFSNLNEYVPDSNSHGTASATTSIVEPKQTELPESKDSNTDYQKGAKLSLSGWRSGLYNVYPKLISRGEDDIYYEHSFHRIDEKRITDSQHGRTVFNYEKIEVNGITYTVSFVTISPYDSAKFLVACDYEKHWRHSTFAKYFIYDKESDQEDSFVPVYDDKALSFVEWSPSGDHVVFVFENNVYLKQLSTLEVKQVTFDGDESIYNGKPDWIYEEEVLSSDRAIWWNDDGSYFTFLRLDDSNVPTFNLQHFFEETGSVSKYPVIDRLKYPKPGFDNPLVSLFSYNVAKQKLEKLNIGAAVSLGEDFVLYSLKWIDNSFFLSKFTDRTSKKMEVTLVDIEANSASVVRKHDATEYNGWFTGEFSVYPVVGDTIGYIDVIYYEDYDHLAYYPDCTSDKYIVLTDGSWNVVGPGVLEVLEDRVYFIGTKESSMEHHLYYTSLTGPKVKAVMDIKEPGYFDVNIKGKYALLSYRGPKLPYQKFIDLSDPSTTSLDDILSSNRGIVEVSLATHSVPVSTYTNVTLEDGVTLNMIEVLPANFNPSKKYPLLVNIYGGPGSQKLDVQFNIGFEHIISSSLDAIVLYIDPRGTGGKSWAFKSYATEKIGYWEPRDITAVVSKWISDHSFVNPDKTAIWGWSYGGFTTLKTLEYDSGEVFKYGMAVAPVTNWLLYDSIYTERYMNLPKDNVEGYSEHSVIKKVSNFKNVNRFLVCHGTTDDNVHFQNTLTLLDQFNINGVVNYDLQVYPDSEHSIAHHNANKVIYERLFKWLERAFNDRFL